MTPEVDIRLVRDKRRVQAWTGDQLVGGITVVPVDFDWGHDTLIPMGGIAAVGTSEQYRGLGIASRMMRRAVEFSLEIGCPVGGVSTGCTNTARRLYSRTGYVYLFSVDRYARAVTRPDLAPPPSGVEVRPFAPGDELAVVDLWRRAYVERGFFGGTAKDPVRWLARRTELLAADPNSSWVALRDGAVVGWAEYYFHWAQGENVNFLVDPSPDSSAVARALLTRTELAMHHAGLRRFSSDASSHETHLTGHLFDYGCRPAPAFVFQVGIFDLAGLLARLQPLFLKRLHAGKLDSWPALLRVRMGGQSAEVPLPGGAPGTRLEISGSYETVVRVLCGHTAAREDYLRGYLALSGDLGTEPHRLLHSFLGQYPLFHQRRDRW